jgi:hypothetical protein
MYFFLKELEFELDIFIIILALPVSQGRWTSDLELYLGHGCLGSPACRFTHPFPCKTLALFSVLDSGSYKELVFIGHLLIVMHFSFF